MSLHKRSNGARVTAATLGDVTDDVIDSDPYVRLTEDLVMRTEFSGGDDASVATDDDLVQRAFRNGEVVRRSKVLALLTPALIKAVTPSSGAAGVALTITGSGFDPGATVTVGGVAATSVVVVNPRKITCVAPAHAAGLVNVIVSDDAGAVTKTGAFTYTA